MRPGIKFLFLVSTSCCCFARSSNKAIRRYQVWWRAFGAHRQSHISGLSTLSARRNCEKLAHWTCIELVSASVNLKKITNVWLHKGIIFKSGETSSHGLHSRFAFICVALGTGAGAGPRRGESVSKESAPLQPWWDSPSSLCCFYFEDGEWNKSECCFMICSGYFSPFRQY